VSDLTRPIEAGPHLPQPDTLAGRLWAAGDRGAIDDMATSAVSGLDLCDADLAELRLYAEDRSWAIQVLAQALVTPEDEPELYPTIAALWLELRFDWQRHNDVMNYAATRTRPLPRVVGHGAVSSAILARLEDLLLPEHRDQLAEHAIRLLQGVFPAHDRAVKSS
jgi:hypothetical protein